jgi:hypothetical protein
MEKFCVILAYYMFSLPRLPFPSLFPSQDKCSFYFHRILGQQSGRIALSLSVYVAVSFRREE